MTSGARSLGLLGMVLSLCGCMSAIIQTTATEGHYTEVMAGRTKSPPDKGRLYVYTTADALNDDFFVF